MCIRDSGKSFAKNIPVSSQDFDLALAGSQNGRFAIGEYTQVLLTNTHAIPFWADGRTDNGNLNIMASFIPIAPVSSVERSGTVSEGVSLGAMSPNPSRSMTAVSWSIARETQLSLFVTDAIGRRIATLLEGIQPAGSRSSSFDTRAYAPGTYYLTLRSGLGSSTRAFVVTR